MNNNRNQFMDNNGLSVNNSLTLFELGDTDDDGEANLIKHFAYYGDNKFADMSSSYAGLTINSLNQARQTRPNSGGGGGGCRGPAKIRQRGGLQ